MWVSLLIGIFILLVIWDYFNKKHRNEILKKSKISGGISLPLIGRALHMLGSNSQSKLLNFYSPSLSLSLLHKKNKI